MIVVPAIVVFRDYFFLKTDLVKLLLPHRHHRFILLLLLLLRRQWLWLGETKMIEQQKAFSSSTVEYLRTYYRLLLVKKHQFVK